MVRIVALALLLAEVNFRCVPRGACDDDKQPRSCEQTEESETGEDTETGEETGELMDLGS